MAAAPEPNGAPARSVRAIQGARPAPEWRRAVDTCYAVVDRFFPACGLLDLTEGIYHGDAGLPCEQAQANQHDYLLDQALCPPGTRILDIGCGYATLLERARRRGVRGVGVTINPEQVRHGLRRGLDVLRCDYRRLPEACFAAFDSVVANGSIEHFVHPDDVASGRADAIYRGLFAIVHRLIDPASPARRFVTTTIHVLRPPSDPVALARGPSAFAPGSDDFHWAVLERGWAGYYPQPGQLAGCAAGYFDLVAEVDGTEDYRLTSEEWLRRVRRILRSPRAAAIGARLLPLLLRAPRQVMTFLRGCLVSESWNWQFRPPDPPTRLLRQTWAWRDRS